MSKSRRILQCASAVTDAHLYLVFWSFVMDFLPSDKTRFVAGVLVAVLSVSGVSAGYAQSAPSALGGVSDADYLSALGTMATSMDLNGLAEQTYEPVTVTAPQLPSSANVENVVLCDTIKAQAEKTGRLIEFSADETTLSENDLAAFSKCMMAESGVLVSFLMPES